MSVKVLKNKKNFLFFILVFILIFGYFFQKNRLRTISQISGVIESQKCKNLPVLPNGTKKLVTKVIDGDTFLIEGGYSVRILGIDADEKEYPCYEKAKEKLEELILNKEVNLVKEREDFDQYCRYLRHVFIGEKNMALELVKEGLAVARFFSDDIKYKEEIIRAEKEAREKKIGCKWSDFREEEILKERDTKFFWEKLTSEITGLKVIQSCEANKYYDKEMIVEGKIADGYRSKTNTVFLNFEKPYPNQCFSAVIFKSDQPKFIKNPENYYENKKVRIRGVIKEYQGKPEIILKDPSQIEVAKETER